MHIRMAERQDLAAIHDLVRELAIYEQAEEEFVASLEDYQTDFDNQVFEVLLAEEAGVITGMALYYMTYSTWKGKRIYLEDLIVTEEERGQGAGKMLFDSIIQKGLEEGCSGMMWQVLDWNEPAINFYKKYYNATIDEQWFNCSLQDSEMREILNK